MSQGFTGSPLAIPVTVPNGGTGITTTTPYSLICAGTTATGSFQSLGSLGTSGQVLLSAGASALPAWTTIPISFDYGLTHVVSSYTYC